MTNNIYPLTTEFIHCKQIVRKNVFKFWIDKDTQNEIDLVKLLKVCNGETTQPLEEQICLCTKTESQSYMDALKTTRSNRAAQCSDLWLLPLLRNLLKIAS